MNASSLYKEVEPAHWVGLMKSDDLLDYLRVRRSATRFGAIHFLPIIIKKNQNQTHPSHSVVGFKY